ncbi:hypothetical protein ACFSJ3_07095 [Corallincola platygyrae]|uniref:Tetratricopeptide repeat protein n=1 Tax=Corallincola platygyrae TaxID=1193278 RepID=A0ABW4XJP9_9GAMM
MSGCSYHADQPQSWHCPSCEKSFCTSCFPGGEGNFEQGKARCPLCRGDLDFVPSDDAKPPFWKVSGDFFKYPLQLQPILLVTILLVLTQIALSQFMNLIDGQYGDIGLALTLAVVIFGWISHYGLTVMRLVADEEWKAPSVFGEEHNLLLTIKLFLAYISCGVAVFATAFVSPNLAIMVMFFLTFAMPAIVMILGITESVRDATNPVLMVKMIYRIGWAYGLLWLAQMAISNGSAYVTGSVGFQSESIKLIVSLLVLATTYFSMVSFAMMGYFLLEHKQKLGIAGGESGETLAPAEFDIRKALGFSHVYLFEGRNSQAFELVKGALRRYPDDLRLRERMHRLLILKGDQELLFKHANKYFDQLIAKGNIGAVARAIDELLAKYPAFRPSVEVASEVASLFVRQGRFEKADSLVGDVDAWECDSNVKASLYLLLAKSALESGKVLSEVTTNAHAAAKLAKPGSPTSLEAAQLIDAAKKMAPQPV